MPVKMAGKRHFLFLREETERVPLLGSLTKHQPLVAMMDACMMGRQGKRKIEAGWSMGP